MRVREKGPPRRVERLWVWLWFRKPLLCAVLFIAGGIVGYLIHDVIHQNGAPKVQIAPDAPPPGDPVPPNPGDPPGPPSG